MSSFVDNALYQSFLDEVDNLLVITNTIYCQKNLLYKTKMSNAELGQNFEQVTSKNTPINKSIDDLEKLNKSVIQFNHWLTLWEKTCNRLIEKFPANGQMLNFIKSVKQVLIGNFEWGLHSRFTAKN